MSVFERWLTPAQLMTQYGSCLPAAPTKCHHPNHSVSQWLTSILCCPLICQLVVVGLSQHLISFCVCINTAYQQQNKLSPRISTSLRSLKEEMVSSKCGKILEKGWLENVSEPMIRYQARWQQCCSRRIFKRDLECALLSHFTTPTVRQEPQEAGRTNCSSLPEL